MRAMNRRFLLLGLLAATTARAQPPESAPAAAAAAPPVAAAFVSAPASAGPRVILATSEGSITIARMIAPPATAANFLRYVDAKKFDGTTFYRALRFPGERPVGLIQGGIKGVKPLPPVAHEPTSTTGLAHIDGAVSMARAAPGTAQGDFFVIVGGLPSLDASDSDPGFAVFGQVIDGMDVVLKINAAPVSPTAGEGPMKGQILAAPVRIVTARRAK